MTGSPNPRGTVAGTVSGTLFTFFALIQTEDLLKTAVLSLLGAVVSFVVTLVLHWIRRKMRSS